MDDQVYTLSAEQYNKLYCMAFARLDEICCAAEKAMAELEELQLSMADQIPPGQPIPFPGRRSQGKKQKNF